VILLDTQAWLRLAADPDRLSRRAASAVRRASRSSSLRISVHSVWEACWLRRRGRVWTTPPRADWIEELRSSTEVEIAPLTPEICALAAELPNALPTDPGDRLIVATALALGCPLVTADERIRTSRCVETIW
jgi:PIN domain nuclease of toxin-antitoxin system